jgi:riboflavin synthase
MFTGIIESTGMVRHLGRDDAGLELTITSPWADLEPGESIAVDGACLTVQSRFQGDFISHIIRTTLERTSFTTYTVGRRVNLERALRVGSRLGGHLVQGHVDGVGIVQGVRNVEDACLVDLSVPSEVVRASVPLGSLTVNGVSLTINHLPGPDTIQISLIPFTLQHTTLGDLKAGDRVHLEADVIGKYVRQFMSGEKGKGEGG